MQSNYPTDGKFHANAAQFAAALETMLTTVLQKRLMERKLHVEVDIGTT